MLARDFEAKPGTMGGDGAAVSLAAIPLDYTGAGIDGMLHGEGKKMSPMCRMRCAMRDLDGGDQHSATLRRVREQ